VPGSNLQVHVYNEQALSHATFLAQGTDVGGPNPHVVDMCGVSSFGFYPGQYEFTITSANSKQSFSEDVPKEGFAQEGFVVHADGSIERLYRVPVSEPRPTGPVGCTATAP
jgi:hypothetical protein